MSSTPRMNWFVSSIVGVAVLLAAVALHAPHAVAALELPRKNPIAKVSQQVGLTEISLEYASPAVKGRRIWGEVVPYDRPWSLSAGHAATVRFSRDVTIGDRSVAAGLYRLYAIVGKGSWSFVLNKTTDQPDNGGDLRFDAGAIRIRAQIKPCQFRERLTFIFSDFTDDTASLDMEWEKLRASISINTNTAKQVMVGINELDSMWRSYANAARFMLETKKDFDAGLRYADQSLALKEDWYTLWIKAALLAAKHDFKEAVEEGERAYQLGQQLGDGFVLEPELKKNLSDWRRRR